MKGWIGVDLDGTLAEYKGWQGCEHIGEPIPVMLARVRLWITIGHDVRIFTARVSGNRPEAVQALRAIDLWCLKHFGFTIPVTNIKDYEMEELWDDRCVQVKANTGKIYGHSRRGLCKSHPRAEHTKNES